MADENSGIEILVFGREGVPGHKVVAGVVKDFIEKINITSSIKYSYYDMDCMNGLAEGAFYDVKGLPATLIKDSSGKIVTRWDGVVPPKKELVLAINKYK